MLQLFKGVFYPRSLGAGDYHHDALFIVEAIRQYFVSKESPSYNSASEFLEAARQQGGQ